MFDNHEDQLAAIRINARRMKAYRNLFLCVKYKNEGKMSCHNWFFNGFCREFKPNYSVLLDAGVSLGDTALLKMYRHLKANEKVGAVCGYVSIKKDQMV